MFLSELSKIVMNIQDAKNLVAAYDINPEDENMYFGTVYEPIFLLLGKNQKKLSVNGLSHQLSIPTNLNTKNMHQFGTDSLVFLDFIRIDYYNCSTQKWKSEKANPYVSYAMTGDDHSLVTVGGRNRDNGNEQTWDEQLWIDWMKAVSLIKSSSPDEIVSLTDLPKRQDSYFFSSWVVKDVNGIENLMVVANGQNINESNNNVNTCIFLPNLAPKALAPKFKHSLYWWKKLMDPTKKTMPWKKCQLMPAADYIASSAVWGETIVNILDTGDMHNTNLQIYTNTISSVLGKDKEWELLEFPGTMHGRPHHAEVYIKGLDEKFLCVISNYKSDFRTRYEFCREKNGIEWTSTEKPYNKYMIGSLPYGLIQKCFTDAHK